MEWEVLSKCDIKPRSHTQTQIHANTDTNSHHNEHQLNTSLDPQSGHTPSVWVYSQPRCSYGRQLIDVSLTSMFLLHLSLSLSQINISLCEDWGKRLLTNWKQKTNNLAEKHTTNSSQERKSKWLLNIWKDASFLIREMQKQKMKERKRGAN